MVSRRAQRSKVLMLWILAAATASTDALRDSKSPRKEAFPHYGDAGAIERGRLSRKLQDGTVEDELGVGGGGLTRNESVPSPAPSLSPVPTTTSASTFAPTHTIPIGESMVATFSPTLDETESPTDSIGNGGRQPHPTAPSPPIRKSTGGSSSDDGNVSYRFIPFAIWYLVLILCCIVPTCCAFRRRRQLEARMARQQATFDQIQQQNALYISNLHLRFDDAGRNHGVSGGSSERTKIKRTKKFTKALEGTTFTIAGDDLINKMPVTKEPEPESLKPKPQSPAEGKGVGSKKDDVDGDIEIGIVDSDDSDNEDDVRPTGNSNSRAVDDPASALAAAAAESNAEHLYREESDGFMLRLPGSTSSPSRAVPGACAICLSSYEAGDQVTWSNNQETGNDCPHAFHTDCIVPWLVKTATKARNRQNLDGNNGGGLYQNHCPCCRQTFCKIEPDEDDDDSESDHLGGGIDARVSALIHRAPTTTPPFGFIPMEFYRQHASSAPVVVELPPIPSSSPISRGGPIHSSGTYSNAAVVSGGDDSENNRP